MGWRIICFSITGQWPNTPPGCVRAIWPRRWVMECCIRWPGLHDHPTSTQFGVEWRKSSQKVLSILWELLQDCWKSIPGEAGWENAKSVLIWRNSNIKYLLKGLKLCIAHGDLWLVCSCLAMETHLMKLPTNSSCADDASRGSLELGSECCNRGQFLHATALGSPVLWACEAYHIEAEPLLLLYFSTSQ